jgi:hypothetical protein
MSARPGGALFLAFLCLSLGYPACAAEDTPAASIQQNVIAPEDVNAWGNSVGKITWLGKAKTSEGASIYKVSYEYDFGDSKVLYIKGLGKVPGKGKFTYFTYEPTIEFRESAWGPVLAVAQSSSTTPALDATVDVPLPSDFSQPPQGRDARWDSKRPFPEIVTETASGNKLQAYAYEQDGVAYLTTCYTVVPGLPPSMVGHVALRISHPHRKGTAGDATWYRIEFASRERRIKETKWVSPARSQEMQAATNRYVDWFITELQTAMHRPK